MKKTFSFFLITLLATPLLRAEQTEWAQVPEILARIQAPVFPAHDFVITNYGAVSDGKTDCTDAIRKAIDRSGRKIVFSTSPGATPVSKGEHIQTHANLWRVSDDFWDNWRSLQEQFARLNSWTPFRAPGHWPDADMLPLGNIRAWQAKGGTHFTKDEQFTLISTNNTVAWVADVPGSKDKYLALFNASPAPVPRGRRGGPEAGSTPAATNAPAADATATQPRSVSVSLADLGFSGSAKVRDLWNHKDLGAFKGTFAQEIKSHDAGLYRLQPQD